MRHASALALVLAPLLALAVLVPTPTAAAATTGIDIRLADPLMTDPVLVQVAVSDGGEAVPFSGRLELAVGRTRSSSAVAGDGGARAGISTRGLGAGWATLTARVRPAGGRERTVVLRSFVRLQPSFALAGFGCAALPDAGGTIRWAVTRLHGEPIRTPRSRDVPALPYISPTGRRSVMTDEQNVPMATSGRVSLLRAGAVVAARPLPKSVRRLVFASQWPRSAVAKLDAGAYIARIELRDRAGRIVTADQHVTVLADTGTPCSG